MHISGIMIVMLIAKLLNVSLHSNFYTWSPFKIDYDSSLTIPSDILFATDFTRWFFLDYILDFFIAPYRVKSLTFCSYKIVLLIVSSEIPLMTYRIVTSSSISAIFIMRHAYSWYVFIIFFFRQFLIHPAVDCPRKFFDQGLFQFSPS